MVPVLWYDGEWMNDKANGIGKSFRAEGVLWYDGEWKDGLRHGGGKEYHADGGIWYDGEWKNGKRHGGGQAYRSDGKLRYDGEWMDNVRNGNGREYDEDGCVTHEGVFTDGAHDAEATSKKRKRESESLEARGCVTRMHRDSPYMADVPTCVLCFGDIHHGDLSFAYVPCGHRVLCGACEVVLAAKWRAKCPCCKGVATALLRIF